MIDADLKLYYARRAREYEEIYLKPERQTDIAALKRRVAELLTGCDVIEIACGTGYWTQVFAPVARSVHATDVNTEVLELARAKNLPADRVSFALGDAYQPDGSAREFSAAFASFWWSHVPRKRLPEFLQALHRALAPGARVVFIDNLYVPGNSSPISRSDDEGNTYQTRTLKDGSAYEVLKNFPDEREVEALLSQRATEINLERLTYYWCLSYRVRALNA